MKAPKRRNPIARSLRSPHLKQKIVESKKTYRRREKHAKVD